MEVIEFFAWIAGVFVVIKLIFNYLAWLYHDKDKSLRDTVQLAWDYLSEHSYFEVARTALERLYDRFAGIFQKRIRFFYLFLFFLLLNMASLWLRKYFFDPAELKALILILYDLVSVEEQLTPTGMMGSTIQPAMVVVSVFQLTLLDLTSFLFTMGIIYMASRSRSFTLFLIELITDISILLMFFGLILTLLYHWLLIDLSVGMLGSFIESMFVINAIVLSYGAFRYLGCTETKVDYWIYCWEYWRTVYRRSNLSNTFHWDPFSPLFVILIFPVFASFIMFFILLIFPYLRTVVHAGPFYYIAFVFLIPIIIFWSLRIFKWRPEDKTDSFIKVIGIIFFLFVLAGGILSLIYYYPLFGKLYQLLLPERNSRFVFILVLSSALPSLAHLLAMAAAIIAKATPKRLQQLINDHLNAIKINDEKVLRQLGNAFGGLGVLITAIIQLIQLI